MREFMKNSLEFTVMERKQANAVFGERMNEQTSADDRFFNVFRAEICRVFCCIFQFNSTAKNDDKQTIFSPDMALVYVHNLHMYICSSSSARMQSGSNMAMTFFYVRYMRYLPRFPFWQKLFVAF